MEGKEKLEFEKRKGWIKNAIIVFLVIMLVLTLLSDTIMNYSLPQVMVQYVESGSITTKVRGSGTVASGDPYNVTVKQTRTVSGINVKVGSIVSVGDVLIYLAEGESDELAAARKALEDAQRAYDLALLSGDMTDVALAGATGTLDISSLRTQISSAQAAVKAAEAEVDAAQANVNTLTDQVAQASAVTVDVTAETNAVNEAQYYYDAYSSGLTTLTTEITELQSKIEYYSTQEDTEENQNKIAEYQKKLSEAQLKLIDQNTLVSNALTQLTQAKANLAQKQALASNDGNVANLRALLSSAETILATKQKLLQDRKDDLNQLTTNITNKINLNSLYSNVKAAQEKVLEEEQKALGGEITSPINGKVIQVNVQSGKETDPSVPVVVMQPEGQGFTLSYSVSNDEAKLIGVGDPGELVNGWWYSNVKIKVASIRPDPSNPTQSKQVTFDIEGEDITAGQSMTISVGARTANYDCIVPNSAIHSDNNGKFVLKLEARSTPLGNRYYAVRCDVTVVAEDDKQSAVTGNIDSWEYVITTSSATINPGDQVRLSDSNQ